MLSIKNFNDLNKWNDLPTGIWIIATPIGNPADISFRAYHALKQAQLILCEDTRKTLHLLSALGIQKKACRRFDAYKERCLDIKTLLPFLPIAFVSDAGTPGVNDPGGYLVQQARQVGIPIIPFPGPSALTTLMSLSGFEGPTVFHGFFPRIASAQQHAIEAMQRWPKTHIWFESPKRILSTLTKIAQMIDCHLCVAKELTKTHEKVWVGPALSVCEKLQLEDFLGEWTFAVEVQKTIVLDDWQKACFCLKELGFFSQDTVRVIAKSYNVSKKQVYAFFLKHKFDHL